MRKAFAHPVVIKTTRSPSQACFRAADGATAFVFSGQGAQRAGPHQAQREADLAGGRAGQELAQRHQIGIAGLVHPASPGNELVAEIAQMRDRPAKGRDAEFQEGAEHLAGRALRSVGGSFMSRDGIRCPVPAHCRICILHPSSPAFVVAAKGGTDECRREDAKAVRRASA